MAEKRIVVRKREEEVTVYEDEGRAELLGLLEQQEKLAEKRVADATQELGRAWEDLRRVQAANIALGQLQA